MLRVFLNRNIRHYPSLVGPVRKVAFCVLLVFLLPELVAARTVSLQKLQYLNGVPFIASITTTYSISLIVLMLLILASLIFYRNSRLQAQTNRQIIHENESLSRALMERDTLLKEVHHRVKNNMQIVASLLCLQSNRLENEELKRILNDSQFRVQSMVLIHQKLYENEDGEHLPFRQFLTELTEQVKSAFGTRMAHVELKVSAPEIHLEVERAVPLGLIVTELCTNAFKHAFDDSNECPLLSVSVTQHSTREFTLRVTDNGVGMKKKGGITKSFGMNLVSILSEQLMGQYNFKSANGTIFTLNFRIDS